jgi:hypothetical protein
MPQSFGHPDAAAMSADSLHIRLCDGIQHMEWPQAGMTADFLGVFFADIAAATGADARSARHAIGYLVNELLENAIKFRVPGGDPVLVAGGIDESGFAFEMHNEATVDVAVHFGTLLGELTSRDPGDLMIERIEADDLRGKLSALIAPPAPDPVDEPTGVTPEVPVDAEQQPAKSGWLRRR